MAASREGISIPVQQRSVLNPRLSEAYLRRGGHLFPNVIRSSVMCGMLAISFVVAAIWFAGGLTWADPLPDGPSPLFSCPPVIGSNAADESGYCKITISPWSQQIYTQIHRNRRYAPNETFAKARGVCVLPVSDPDAVVDLQTQVPIYCWAQTSCWEATNWDPLNPYSVSSIAKRSNQPLCELTIGGMRFSLGCFEIQSAEAYCDVDFTIKPQEIISIRGVLLGILLLWVLLVSHDVYIWVRRGIFTRLFLKYRSAFLEPTMGKKSNELLRRCHLRWSSSFVATSIHSGSVLSFRRTLSSDSLGDVAPSPGSKSSLPYQPVLSPRTSLAFESKASRTGYSPRLDSPPVGVMTSIQGSTTRLARFGGSIEALFSSAWRRRVARNFDLRLSNMKAISAKSRNNVIILSFLIFVGFYILMFRLIFCITSRPMRSMSLWGLVSLGSDRTSSVGDIVADDLSGERLLFFWIEFLAFIDVFYRSFLLLLCSPFATVRPSDMSHRDNVGDKESSVKLENKPTDAGVLDETQVPASSESVSDFGGGARLLTSANAFFVNRRSSTTSSMDMSLAQLIDCGYDRECCETSICAMLSVVSPCSSEAGRLDFVRKLKSLQKLIANDEDIFVIDCGSSPTPLDDTEYVICREVSDRINYVYFPEPDRIVSLYWTSKFWIPFLFSSNRCGDYIYSLIVDESVRFPSSFLLPDQDYLLGNPKIKAMYIPTAEDPLDENSFAWMNRLRERIQLISIFRIAGSTSHAGTYCPQIWERNTFEMTCFNLKSGSNQHGLCLRANGRALLKQRCGSLITVYVSDRGIRPVRSTRSVLSAAHGLGPSPQSLLSYFWDLIDPSSIWHLSSFFGLPFVFGSFLNVLFDSIRILIASVMLTRDPLGFAFVSIIAGIVSAFPLLLNQAACYQTEVHFLKKTLILVFLHPFSLILVDLPVRVIRLFKLKLIPILIPMQECEVTIGERDEEFRDLPVVPPHPCPHWSSVWM